MNMEALARFRAGEERTFQRIVEEYSPRLLGIIRPFAHDLDEAHDLLQEAWLRAYDKRRTFRGSGSLLWGHMGPGMMGHMRSGMGMKGMMGSPEIMGSMMSIRGEMMSLMGQMMHKYGIARQMTPEVQQQMNKEMLEGMGEILTKHGAALKERAKAVGK